MREMPSHPCLSSVEGRVGPQGMFVMLKMFAAVASPIAGTVKEIAVKVGESVESKDLLVRLVK